MVVVMKKISGILLQYYTYPCQEAKTILEETRRKIAHELHMFPPRNYLTLLGTEANLILKSAVEDLKIERIITQN